MEKQTTDNKLKPPSAAYDVQLLFPVLFLVGIGIVMVYSASSALALKKFGTDYYFLKKQSTFALMGIVALVLFNIFSDLPEQYPLFGVFNFSMVPVLFVVGGVIFVLAILRS